MSTMDTQQPPESVATQLRDLERQGGAMASLAHVAAGLLLAAFSAGSLVSISHAAFVAFLAALAAHQADIPDGISLAVNLLLVLAADIALLYAASVLRVLTAAQAPASERRVHVWAMVGASLLEASTYLYLAWQFDRPSDLFLWVIVLARAVGAPLFAAYLSMARPLPVAPRDVAYQASLAAGRGVVRDVATLAADPAAPLERKARIYTASALMTAQDRTRFDGIISAVSTPPSDTPTAPELARLAGVRTPDDAAQATGDRLAPTGEGAGSHHPPTGGGTPTQRPRPRQQPVRASGDVLRMPSRRDRRTGRRVAARASVEPAARAAWRPGMTVTELGRAAGISRTAARTYRAKFNAEQNAERQAEQNAQPQRQDGVQYAQ